MYIPEGIKGSFPVVEEAKVPGVGDVACGVGFDEEAVGFELSGINGFWELRKELFGHVKPAASASRLCSMGPVTNSNECEDRGKLSDKNAKNKKSTCTKP